jgi:anti-sigma B factor antagonist
MFERTTQGAVEMLAATAPINADGVSAVTRALESYLQAGQPRVVLDLERVPLLDSAGLETLLDFRDLFLERGGSLKLAAPNALCRDILAVTGVGSQFEVFGDTVSAVGSFTQ